MKIQEKKCGPNLYFDLKLGGSKKEDMRKEEKIYYLNSNGDRICGILREPEEDKQKPLVIICHGLYTGKDSKTSSRLAHLLNQHGFGIFRFDFFGHGESDGLFENLTISEGVDDVVKAIELLQSKGYKNIGLVGSSFGGLTCLMTASQRDDICFLVLRAPVSNFKERDMASKGKAVLEGWKEKGFIIFEEHKYKYSFFEDYDKNNGYEAAPQVKAPTLIVHGTKDESVSISQSRKLVTLIPNARLVEIPDCGHLFNGPGQWEKTLNLIIDFIIEQSK